MSFDRRVFLALMPFLLATPIGFAAPISSGNVLVSEDNVLYEYTPAGAFVQSFDIPDSAGAIPNSDTARDIAVKAGSTNVHVYNGTFTASMSTLDSTSPSWTHQTIAGLSTVNNVSYGGIAVAGPFVFVTDMATAGAGAPQGIVRFDSSGGSIRFATGIDPIDLNVGQDGMLYALADDVVYVYDPRTAAFQYSFDLDVTIGAGDYRSVAANAAGQLFVVDWSGNLRKTDANGTQLLSTNIGGNLTDVDVSAAGIVVVGEWAGDVTVTDENFTSPSSFTVGSTQTFVAVAANSTAGLPVSPVAVYAMVALIVSAFVSTLRRLRARPHQPAALVT